MGCSTMGERFIVLDGRGTYTSVAFRVRPRVPESVFSKSYVGSSIGTGALYTNKLCGWLSAMNIKHAL